MKDDLKKRSDGLLSFDDYDANNDRLTYWSGLWSGATTYSQYEEVYHEGAIWTVAAGIVDTTQEPTIQAAHWTLKVPSSGRGAMTIDAPKASLGVIGAGWTPIDEFDSTQITPIGLTLTIATGLFNFTWPGIWSSTLLLVFNHDESNSGRETFIRLFNVTDAVPVGNPIPWFIARNQPGTNIILPFSVQVNQLTGINKDYRFEIGGGDAITVGLVDAQSLELFQLGVSL